MGHAMRLRLSTASHQKGGVLILVGISLAVLIGFLGIVVDLGRLFVTKTELQTAMDACALAAAGELKPGVNPPDTQAITRAVSAGITAGTRNRVGFQAAAATITAADIYFSDRLSDNSGTFPFGYVLSASADPATARYVLCARKEGGIATWFMQVLQGFLGNAPTPNTVGAWATATLKPAQLNCAIPIGVCTLAGNPSPAADPFAGMQMGTWLSSKLEDAATGSFSWVDFSPNAGGANEAAELIKGPGLCNVPAVGAQVGQQGNIESLDKAWNTRFGLYKGGDSLSTAPPDRTGYAYTPLNWPARFDAFGGTDADDPNFTVARGNNSTYQGIPGQGYQSATQSELAQSGARRRLVVVPIVDCSAWAASNPQTVPVLGYACVLMLHPMTHTSDPLYSEDVWLEFRGAANDPNSSCDTSGLAGGTAGPLVPVLVH
jgi:Putative Flp pilus-assembly TadE/G-like